MSFEQQPYTNGFLNILAHYCGTEIIVSVYLIENKMLVGRILAMTEHFIELSTLKHEYVIPVSSIKYVSTEKERIGQ